MMIPVMTSTQPRNNKLSLEQHRHGTKQLCWLVGQCKKRSNKIEWSKLTNKNEAQAQQHFQAVKACETSVVLFEGKREEPSNKLSYIPVLFSGQHPADVAVILEAFESVRETICQPEEGADIEIYSVSRHGETLVDRAMVEQQVADGDAPMVPPSRSEMHQWFLKLSMNLTFYRPSVEFFSAGPHRMASLCYFDVNQHPAVRGHVALTLDDAPCRFGPANSRVDEIRSLLDEHNNSKATFMLVGSFIRGHEDQLIRALRDGHELGNHGRLDQAHDGYSDDQFLESLDDCSEQIRALQRQAQVEERVRYFRAPHGKYTRRMETLIRSRNMVNVMCDSYSSDPIVEDGEYIAKNLVSQARHGSIILLHIPERGFRDYCMVGLRGLLEALNRRNLRVVSVGMLEQLANQLQ